MSFQRLDPSRIVQGISPTGSGASATPHSNPSFGSCDPSVAADRARILLGCYRKGDANDPEVYAGAMISVLSRYPESVARSVTEPATGLPSRLKWLPSVAEVVEACEAEMNYLRRALKRQQAIDDTVRSRLGIAAPAESPAITAARAE
jgi:hypothetical protein